MIWKEVKLKLRYSCAASRDVVFFQEILQWPVVANSVIEVSENILAVVCDICSSPPRLSYSPARPIQKYLQHGNPSPHAKQVSSSDAAASNSTLDVSSAALELTSCSFVMWSWCATGVAFRCLFVRMLMDVPR